MALVLEGLLDFARYLKVDEVIRQGVEVSEIIVLVILLHALARPHLHQLLNQLLHFSIVPLARASHLGHA